MQHSFTSPFNPDLAGLVKPEEDYSAEELAPHIKPEMEMKETTRALSRLPFMGGLRSIPSSYRPFYLDPEVRHNLALYSENDPAHTLVYRRVSTTEQTSVSFDVWGLRQDIGHKEVAKAYERQKQKVPQRGVVFSPKPSLG